MLGSNYMVGLWWFSFVVNSVYYGGVLFEICQRWLNENSEYEWKDTISPIVTSSSNLITDDLRSIRSNN